MSSAEPWLWLLVRREKTLRSLRGLVGGDEGGVKPTSEVLSRGVQKETHDHKPGPGIYPLPRTSTQHREACSASPW